MDKKVLVIEDSPMDASMIQGLLAAEGLSVEIASSGKEGINKALEQKPDLITLDLVLPDMSGFEVCSRLKSEVSLYKTIIVVLSVKDNIEDITKAFHVGADDYLIKPPQVEFLVRKIKLYLGIRP